MVRAFAIVLTLMLSVCGEPWAVERLQTPACIESVHVVAPGDEVTCPWGTMGHATPVGDNVAFHCICPRDGGLR